ncbi:hypothetical protein NC652_040300 [Populus alba x Populus x berolinensis]|nr:hypothetical protein NC652_040300 [Populus alba x Populus x berolinensis]
MARSKAFLYFARSGGSSSGVREFLEGLLCNWSLVDGKYHVLVAAEADVAAQEGCDGRYLLEVDK